MPYKSLLKRKKNKTLGLKTASIKSINKILSFNTLISKD